MVFNYFVEVPWEGFSYRVAGMDIEGNRKWTAISNVSRVAGLCRSSFEAAILIAACGIAGFLMTKNPIARLSIIAAGLTCIILTTTKGMVVALAALIVLGLAVRWVDTFTAIVLRRIAAGMAAIVMIALPLWSCFGTARVERVTRTNSIWQLNSIDDRMSYMWPEALHPVFDGATVLTGFGLGSIGVPYGMFVDPDGNTGDNLFVYLCHVWGLPSVVMIGTFCLGLWKDAARTRLGWFHAGFVMLVYGVTTNLVESAIPSFVLGGLLACGIALRRNPTASREVPAIERP